MFPRATSRNLVYALDRDANTRAQPAREPNLDFARLAIRKPGLGDEQDPRMVKVFLNDFEIADAGDVADRVDQGQCVHDGSVRRNDEVCRAASNRFE